MMMVVRQGMLVLVCGLLACEQEPPAVSAPPAAVTPPAEPEATPPPPAAASSAPELAAIQGTWYQLAERDGQLTSRDWCDADRMGIEVSADRLQLNYAQDGDILQIVSARAEGDALVIAGHLTDSTEAQREYQLRLSPEGWLTLDVFGETWRLARREQIPDERFLVSCCRDVEGSLPEEVAVVAFGGTCPPQ